MFFNSKGPCGKSFAKTDNDLHAWFFLKTDVLHMQLQAVVGSSSQATHLMRHSAMDDSIGGSYGVTGLTVQRTAQPYESEPLDLRPTLAR